MFKDIIQKTMLVIESTYKNMVYIFDFNLLDFDVFSGLKELRIENSAP